MPFTLSCTIEFAANFTDTLCFHKEVTREKWCVYQNLGNCTTAIPELKCGFGTSESNSTTKDYEMTIRVVRENSKSRYWCDLQKSGARSNWYTLEINGGYSRQCLHLCCGVVKHSFIHSFIHSVSLAVIPV